MYFVVFGEDQVKFVKVASERNLYCGCVEMGRKGRLINDIGISHILINDTRFEFEYKKKLLKVG